MISHESPSQPAPHRPSAFDTIVERNIRTLLDERRRTMAQSSFSDRIAVTVSAFAGSMSFVYLHLCWFGLWMLYNSTAHWMGAKPFDPFPFGLLTMIGSLEAIFISTFVLISQNRMAAQAEQRADLDVQINLLAEHEVTRLLRMMEQLHEKFGITPDVPELEELKEDVSPKRVLEEIRTNEKALCEEEPCPPEGKF